MEQAEILERPRVEAMDQILGQKFQVLDDEGFVRVVDYMGSDASIVQAARISYGKGTKSASDDRSLIRYLMRHRHTSPFEMIELKIHVRVPMDLWRQWIRHRTASVNEYSTRYSEAIDAAHLTPPGEWRAQSVTNKQGSGGFLHPDTGEVCSEDEINAIGEARRAYERLIARGVAREQARKILPLSTYTEAYWKIDGHNLFHFLGLRLDGHAQAEIQRFSNTLAMIVESWVPYAWEAFKDYRLDALTLTGPEIETFKSLVSWYLGRATFDGMSEDSGPKLSNREMWEFRSKLQKLGLLKGEA